ncbi:TetR/AcrR family transcriptional regulator [Cohaesibacter celericrescens]|uniref:TetR family transcriptional regulator n=1 Tax=Cohaesibacter celericrescens TaxID=2067669 RepID=A0A2N5XV82_9HYPH|nr:TetR/AcrR family transcriptional regulator [Cohaesibacter celericrescens]PLW78404.1 TetR family transcriptional regulator [Cohaesibacter celericrescens]
MQKKTEQTRDHILTVGRELISAHGFNAMGLGLLLKHASVPKGSFYHYFSSKEDFGCKLLELYVEAYHERLDTLWSKEGRTGREGLMEFFDQWIITQSPPGSKSQCLIVKLGAEVSDMSDAMRSILSKGAVGISDRLATQIRIGIKDSSLSDKIDSDATASLLYQMWLGASLLAKLEQSVEPFRMARRNSEMLLPTG